VQRVGGLQFASLPNNETFEITWIQVKGHEVNWRPRLYPPGKLHNELAHVVLHVKTR
jgi:hypothetical protein